MGGGGSKGSNTTKSSFKLPPEFVKAYSESLGLARQAINQPYQQYQGQLVAGMTPTQQQGLANVNASQGMALPFINEGAGYTREAARGITPELYERFYSPYVRDVANATQANLNETAAQQRSGLKSGAIGAGAFGGDRSGIAQAEMARQQLLANSQNLSNIYNQGYTQAMGLAGNQVQNLGAMGQQLAGMGTGAQASALQGAQAQLTAGAQEQATNQAQLQAAYDQFLQRQSYPFQLAQFFANIAQGLGSTAGGSSSTTAPGPNTGSQIMGGIGAAANLASLASASDERVKENIEAVGQLNDGQTIYRYNFKGDPKTQIGLLAQEVEKVNPDAVGEVNGLKMVDYKGATDDAASSMGGVVAPGSERGGFMDGGVPYGGSGFIPQSPMMAAASNKIPAAATMSANTGLAGAADMTNSFTDVQKEGLANIGNMFAKPSLYNSGGVVGRHGYATDGGVPYLPYSGARGYVPEGKMGSGSNRIPGAPDPFQDKGLSEEWKDIKPLSEDQVDRLKGLAGRIRGYFADPNAAALDNVYAPDAFETAVVDLNDKYGQPKMSATNPGKYTMARGGVAGRRGYQFGGEPTMDDALAEAEASGVAAAPDAPKAEFRLPSKAEVEAYIAQSARKRGIDPEIALKVYRSEGGTGDPREAWQSKIIRKDGTREPSYSPFQLYMDGGLGSAMEKSTGLSPADPRNWQPSVDFALEQAAKGGWGPWNGAKAIGLAPDAGLSGARATGDMPSIDTRSIVPMSADASGVAAIADRAPSAEPPMESETKSPFSMKDLFASDKNPSVVESIIGRRLSPEARSALLNASFALMAGKSPFFLTNVGEAGKVGTQTYYNALAQKRELQKQQADIARQGYEAQTGRMQVDVSERNAARQQAALVLPYVKNLIANGQPVPDFLTQMLEAASPGAMGELQSGKEPSGLTSPVAGAASPEAAGPSPAAIPAPQSESIGSGQPPLPGGLQPAPITSEAEKLLSQLPEQQQPAYFYKQAERMAKAGASPEEVMATVKMGNDLLAKYNENGIPLPSGTVSYPGVPEKQARQKRVELGAEQAGKSVNQIYTDLVAAPQQNYAQTYSSLKQASDILQNFQSGSLATVKGNIAGLMQSLGLPVDPKSIEDAADVEKLQKIFIGGLLNSGLREKFGQVAVGELDLAMKSTGSPNTQPAANRSIVGTMKGVLDWQKSRAEGIAEFIKGNGGLTAVDPIELQQYASTWDKKLPDFIEQGIANTPVKGDINWSNPEDRKRARVGRLYIAPKTVTLPSGKVVPEGSVVKYTADGFEPVEQ